LHCDSQVKSGLLKNKEKINANLSQLAAVEAVPKTIVIACIKRQGTQSEVIEGLPLKLKHRSFYVQGAVKRYAAQ
jgi:hypothetical protein